MTDHYQFEPIGLIRTPYPEKFAVPRQPGLVSAATAHIELQGGCNREEILRGIEGFSHLWLIFVFHQAQKQNWKPTVRPPRLGGNERVGVFASRSPFRPNPIGMSVVSLNGIERVGKQWHIHVGGADLVDHTPILDIKPYLPYADALPEARAEYAPAPPSANAIVTFSTLAQEQLDSLQDLPADFKELITQVLAQQPQPAYHNHCHKSERRYGMTLYHYNIEWMASENGHCLVTNIKVL